MSDYFDRVERQIVRNVEAGMPRSPRLPAALRYLASAAAVLVVIVVAGVFLLARGSTPAPAPAPATGHTATVTFTASTIDPLASLGAAIDRSIPILRARLGSDFPGVRVSRAGNEIVVTARNANADARARILALVGTTPRLAFYDWEANVITPNGKTVASQLQTQDPTATEISQGATSQAPGSPGAGSMSLYDAVQLASKQPESSSPTNSRLGPQYYIFGAPGSAACQVAANANNTVPAAGQHCLLSGPDDNKADLLSGLPAGVSASEGQIVTVPQGTVVLQAIPQDFSKPTPVGDPSAQFFVLKDNAALRGSDITNPQQSTDPNTPPARRHVRVQQRGQERVPERHREHRSPWGLGQRPRADAQSAFRGRARQPADHGPVHRLQAVPGRDQRRQRSRHQRELHDLFRAGSRQPAAPERAPRQPQGNGVNGYITTTAANTVAIHAMQTMRPAPICLIRSATAMYTPGITITM